MEQRNLLPIVINIDSAEIINILKIRNLHYDALLDDCRSILRRLRGSVITHCFREQNGVADLMAKQGAALIDFVDTRSFEVSPLCVARALGADNA